MTIELLYTSAAQGLKQGSRGFCTVVCTAGLPINLAQRLESLSGYRHLYQPGDQRADDNPVCHSHIRLAVGGKTLSILSRVGAYGVDYSQRTNKIAHHVVFDGAVPACGPAAVLSQAGIMRTDWDGECKTLQNGPHVPPLALQPAPCHEWQRITGDAGWAGVVANAWLQPAGKPVWIVFSESQSASLLDLMQEATAILPESRRWQATFSTYCTNLPPDVECRVRCVIAGSDEARMSIARGTVLDLTKPMGLALDNDACESARNGCSVVSVQKHASQKETYLTEFNHEDSSTGTTGSDQSEYRLKRELPGNSPPAINQRKLKRVEDARVINPKSHLPIKILVSTVVAGLMMVLATIGIATFFYFKSPKPLAVVENHLTNTHETTVEQTPDAVPDPDPLEEDNRRQAPEAAKPPTRKITLLKDSHSETSFEWRESAGTVDELFLADIDIAELPNLDWTKIAFHSEEQTLPNKFIARDGKLFLKSKELAQLRSKKYAISIDYNDGDIQSEPFEFQLNFINDADPDIELLIGDIKSSESGTNFQKSDFAAGTVLIANVTREDRDEVPGNRKWSWYRRISGSNGNDGWQLIVGATEQTYKVQLESDTGHEIQSWLEYDSNNPESATNAWITKVESKSVQILKPTNVTILIPQFGVQSINDLIVSASFHLPQFSKNAGKTKMVYNYLAPSGVKMLINAKSDTNIQLKSLVPEGEIAKLTQETQNFLNATREFAIAIGNFKTNIRVAKSKSKDNKHLLTIEKLLFKSDSKDPMDLIFGYLANREKAAQLIDDTLKLYQLLNVETEKLNKEQEGELAELMKRYIDTESGYPLFNNHSLFKDLSRDDRILSVIIFKLFWDGHLPVKDVALIRVANLPNFLNSWNGQTGLSYFWREIKTVSFVSHRDQFTQHQFGTSANGRIVSTEMRSEEMGPNTKPFLDFPIWLDVKIKLRPELLEKTP